VGVAGALLTLVLPEKSGLSLDAAAPPVTSVYAEEPAERVPEEPAERVPAKSAA
jgi:hypothetical protein